MTSEFILKLHLWKLKYELLKTHLQITVTPVIWEDKKPDCWCFIIIIMGVKVVKIIRQFVRLLFSQYYCIILFSSIVIFLNPSRDAKLFFNLNELFLYVYVYIHLSFNYIFLFLPLLFFVSCLLPESSVDPEMQVKKTNMSSSCTNEVWDFTCQCVCVLCITLAKLVMWKHLCLRDCVCEYKWREKDHWTVSSTPIMDSNLFLHQKQL